MEGILTCKRADQLLGNNLKTKLERNCKNVLKKLGINFKGTEKTQDLKRKVEGTVTKLRIKWKKRRETYEDLGKDRMGNFKFIPILCSVLS